MDKKVISIDEIKEERFKNEFPDTFNLEDAIKYSNTIEYYLNSFYNLALEDKKYHSVCTTEQMKILSDIYSSFFKILFNELDAFDGSKESNRIMFEFISELYKICNNLTDADDVRKNIDNSILGYKKED